jgi:hypothetical protein
MSSIHSFQHRKTDAPARERQRQPFLLDYLSVRRRNPGKSYEKLIKRIVRVIFRFTFSVL